MKRTLSFALIFLRIVIFVNASGFYSIVAPGTIQSQLDYSVSVTVHENCAPTIIKVGIKGPSLNKTKIVHIYPSNTKVVNFEIPKLEQGTYKLVTEGVKGLIFKNSTELNFRNKEPKIYIQTDKAVYKPGDLVQYRIIVLDENTRPAKLRQSLRLDFKDGAGNFVKQINDLKLTKGVYTGDFQLSDEPVLGEWFMVASLDSNEDDTKTVKKFEVDKYVLPKFNVDIETAKDIAYTDALKITVRSKYTYGKPVKGQATITVSGQYNSIKSEKTIDVNGKGYVEFNLAKDLGLEVPGTNSRFAYYIPPITILVVMTEEYTGNQQNKTSTVNLHRSRYSIEVSQYVYQFVANKSFEINAFVKNIDGSPVQNGKHVAKLIINKNGSYYGLNADIVNKGDIVFTSKLDKNGKAVFKVILPESGYYQQVRLTYGDEIIYLPSLTGMKSNETKPEDVLGPLKLIMKTEKLQLTRDIIVEVKSNKNIPYYVYAIIARGNIIKQEHVKLTRNVKSHKIKIKPTFEMVPVSYLYVYFVLDGELKFQEMTLNFPKEFQNKITITAPEEAKPSEEVTLKIKTDPNSLVGLLGVDQSVLLLKSGNDFDSEKIINDLNSYQTSTPYVRGYGIYPGRSSGLVTLTNANYPYNSADYPIYVIRPTFVEFAEPNIDELLFVRRDSVDLSVNSAEPQIRKEFIESWIFTNINNTDCNGVATLTKTIPDTITSWVVTGFSMNDKTGFGMVSKPTNINVFLPFFLSTNLPYSVKRGEIISIPIVVFNYMDKTVEAKVTMENTDDEYDFTEVSNETEELVLKDKQRVKIVSVAANSGSTVSFMIRPKKVGEITLKIKAITPLAGDAMHKKLKVEPEGVTQYGNEAIFLTLTATSTLKETIKADIPKEAVLDSEYLEFAVVGDILGPTIKNIDKLVRKPFGCGEQNMVNFVPNILVLHYLDAMKRDMPTVIEKAKKYMEIGYQHELTFKHKNGAFSAFGEGRSEPNNWLTAYVARSFIQARKYITIDSEVIKKAFEYVVSTQLETGQFKQTGRLFHPSYQNDMGFTAFILLALVEDMEYANKYKTEIDKGIKHIVDNLDKESDTYALAIVVVLLKKVQHPSVDKLMKRLEILAIEENGLKWWTRSSKDTNNDIEITAYILDAYVHSEPAGNLLPIIKWLIGNRNSMGSFDSTQGTVVGLQALINFAEKYISGGDGKMNIKFVAQDAQCKETTTGNFIVDKDNSLILQTHVLPPSSRQILLEAQGEGSALVQLSYRYNLATKDDKPSFIIKNIILPTPHPGLLEMKVCGDFEPGDNNNIKESNMAIMEIYLPSGFTADTDKFDEIAQTKQVQRVETKNSDTVIIIYFDYLRVGEDICFNVNAEKTHAVAKQKPVAITMYDYYNSDQRATVYYEVKSSLFDICEKGEC